MDLAMWIVGGWLGISVVTGISLMAAIRASREQGDLIPIPVRSETVRRR